MLLRESNGIDGAYGAGLIWPTEGIVSENLAMREDAELATLYMPFDPLLFFADVADRANHPVVNRSGSDGSHTPTHPEALLLWLTNRPSSSSVRCRCEVLKRLVDGRSVGRVRQFVAFLSDVPLPDSSNAVNVPHPLKLTGIDSTAP
jgi:hypothetical protein